MICRLCLSDPIEYLEISSINPIKEDGEEFLVLEIIQKYFDLALNIISNLICTNCWRQIKDFHNFCRSIEEKQKEFLYQQSQALAICAESTNAEMRMDELRFKDENGLDNTFKLFADEEIPTAILEEIPCIWNDTESLKSENQDKVDLPSVEAWNTELVSTNTVSEESKDAHSASCVLEDQDQGDEAENADTTILADPLTISVQENATESEELSHSDDKKQQKPPCKRKKTSTIMRIKNLSTRRNRRNIDDCIITHVGTIKCDLCGESLQDFKILGKHFRKEHNCPGYAVCCKRKFYFPKEYAEHLEWHTNKNLFKCEACDSSYLSRKSYENHVDRYHPTERLLKYQCSKCPLKFARKYLMNDHIRACHELLGAPHQCETCNKIFKTRQILLDHQNSRHLKVNESVCDICGKVFLYKVNYETHKATVHKSIEETRVECPICHRWFKNSFGLYRHNKEHQEGYQKEFKCQVCGVVKKKKKQLTAHTYYHHKEPLHKCSICDKELKSKTKLMEHMSGHTGVPNYKCEFCPKMFNDSGNAIKHKKLVHKDKYVPNQSKINKYKPPDRELSL